jgi:hypothetical protein
MDDKMRDGLRAALSHAQARRAGLQADLKALSANIHDVRAALGNPFFYSPRPDDHPQSRSKFTGYASHDPALQLIRGLQEATRAVATAERQLRDAGLEPG